MTTIHWFRDDLRLADNPALRAAAEGPVACIYILDEGGDRRPIGGASLWWLSRSLDALGQALEKRGAALHLFKGDPAELLPRIAKAFEAKRVTWNRRYEAATIALDKSLKTALKDAGIAADSFNSHLLNEPWDIAGKSGDPLKVYSAYWRAVKARGEPSAPMPAPRKLDGVKLPASLKSHVVTLADLALEPTKPDWAGGLREEWTPGEAGAAQRLSDFLDEHSNGYAQGRDRPDQESTSRLSPHLRHGEIGPRQIWQAVRTASESGAAAGSGPDMEKFLAEIGWREFSYHLLFYNPDLATVNFNRRFDAFPWRKDPKGLAAWQKGLTGYPLVDAGMRQLWTTGWMHNRVRMLTASFLIKHLLVDWREGEAWFWDTLVDADPANNTASWQWVAGSGADAAPYFRIFNPVTQARKFDPEGDYVRRWVPELAALSDDDLQEPWRAEPERLREAGITLGDTYPKPIVDLDAGRERALAALAETRTS